MAAADPPNTDVLYNTVDSDHAGSEEVLCTQNLKLNVVLYLYLLQTTLEVSIDGNYDEEDETGEAPVSTSPVPTSPVQNRPSTLSQYLAV